MAFYNFDAMQLRVAIAQRALVDPSALEGAFIWSMTPQGEEYWRGQCDNGLTEEGRSTLAYMIAQSMELSIVADLHMMRAAA
ncbi:hypothetical protein BTE77_06835 [Ensifer adhaerens]|nr:hypothetical protein BTE77_06835 [Ensifer adhaerens]